MMVLPFVTALAAVLLAWRGRRGSAIAATLVTFLITLVLFRLHATDSLAIDL